MKNLVTSFVCLIVLMLSQNAFAVPSFPENCFDGDSNYCSQYDVVHSAEADRKVIRINFYAKLDAENFVDEWDIYDLFVDFEAWGDYTCWVEDYGSASTEKKAKKSAKKALEDYQVTMLNSESLDPVEVDGVEALVHQTAYYTGGPWPFTTNKVVERSLYYELPTAEGALISFKMILDPSYADQQEGVQYKTGVMHIAYDEDEEVYNLFFVLDVVPEIDLLPSVAAPYVGKAFISVFEGMFADFL